MSKSTGSRPLDVRTTERNLKHGLLSRKEVAKYLESLPDVASKATSLGDAELARAGRTTDDD